MRLVDIIQKEHPGPMTEARLIVPFGSGMDGDREGIAHFVEHMAFKGTEDMPLAEFNRRAPQIGYFNAYTSFDKTVFYCSALREDAWDAITLLLDMVAAGTMPAEEVAREKGVITEEIGMWRNDPHKWFWWRTREHAFGETLGHFPGGSEKSVADITRDDMLAWRDKSLESAVLVVVGGDHIATEMYAGLGEKHAAGDDWTHPTYGKSPGSGNLIFSHASTQATIALIGDGLPYRQASDRKWADDVAASIIGGGTHSLLWPIREAMGLCYSIGCGSSSHDQFGYSYANAILAPKNVDKCRAAMDKAIKAALAGDWTDEQFETSRKIMARGMANGWQTAGAIAHIGDSYFANPDRKWMLDQMDPQRTIDGVLSLTRSDVQDAIDAMFGARTHWAIMLPEGE